MKRIFICIVLSLFLAASSYAADGKMQADLYLDLMKRSLTNWIYGDVDKIVVHGGSNVFKRMVVKSLNHVGYQLVKPAPMNKEKWSQGIQTSNIAHTMIGLKRLDNIQFCMEKVLAEKIPGDFIECGAWRGGATIFMRAVLKAHGVTNRVVYVADSFEGLPKPDLAKYPQDKGMELYMDDSLAVSLEEVKSNFDRYNLLDGQVYFLKGWFKDTLPKAPIKKLAVLRVDADMYESTMDSLVHLYPKLSKGGYLIIDDYGTYPACKSAVDDYRKANGIHDEIIKIDNTGIYWRKSK